MGHSMSEVAGFEGLEVIAGGWFCVIADKKAHSGFRSKPLLFHSRLPGQSSFLDLRGCGKLVIPGRIKLQFGIALNLVK